jgi:AraC-like DNA-binding protein
MNEYWLFPDIKLICGADKTSAQYDISITYCINGIREYCIDGRYFYLKAGNYIILRDDNFISAESSEFSAATVIIDDKNASNSADNILFDISILTDKLYQQSRYIFTANEDISRIFTEICTNCCTYDMSMLRIKTIEALMLISNYIETTTSDNYSKIKLTGELICSNISSHFTISQLSDFFELNPTTLKNAFKQYHGCPVYSYVKNRRMFRAAELLSTSDMRIIDIAEEVGYCNASKFSSAFREVIGKNPKHYQTEHKKLRAQQIHFIPENFAY